MAAVDTDAPAEAAHLESFSPATGARIGSVPVASAAEVERSVAAAAAVQPFWAELPPAARGRFLRRAAQVIIDSLEELAVLLAREQGRPRTEAVTMELYPSVDALHWLADHGPRLLRDERARDPQVVLLPKRHRVVLEPLGVVGVIAPAERPWATPLGQVATALMAGNAVVLKPSELAPLAGQRIEEVLGRAGLPEGLVRTVHGGPEAGQALARSDVATVFFTGSPEAGRSVHAACAARTAGAVLELGGSDPMLVLADAPLEHAVAGALWGAYANAGQASGSIERALVVPGAGERFADRLAERARRLRVGDPLDPATEVGPMLSAARRDHVAALVEEAVADGATLRCGGTVPAPEGLDGAFFAPAVLTGVTPAMRIAREPARGPVIAVAEVDSEEEALARANDSTYGLGASVWTCDRVRGERVALRLEAGMTWVNDHGYSQGFMQLPWGGAKGSGLGRSHGRLGLEACVNAKLVGWEPARTRDPWWHPYDHTLAQAATTLTRLAHGRDAEKRAVLRAGSGAFAAMARRVLRGR